MRIRATVSAILLLIIFTPLSLAASPGPNLQQLYKERRYFELRDALREYGADKSPELLFYRGVVSNKFNQTQSSIGYFKSYLKQAKGSKDFDRLVECYEMLADNYRKAYRYAKAAESYTTILNQFGSHLDAEKREDFENAVRLWGALAKVPRQRARFDGDSKLIKDQQGHIPLEINNQSVGFIFDTGANLSVIRRALAEQLSLKIIDASIDVGAIAGNKVKAKLAVADKIRLRNATINNGVFLVFDDKDLYVSEANFQIDGLIGFPVIEALRVVTFIGDKEILIPAVPTAAGEQNMCLDGLSPLIAGHYKGERLTFAFDTGADTSVLYPPFYKKYEDEIKAKYATYTERVRGVGGHKEIGGYLAKNLAMEFSGKEARFQRLPILTEHTLEKSRYFYGNLGQDLVKQYQKMTLNFMAMSIIFE